MGELKYDQIAKIRVFGIGGAGCNAVNRMVDEEVKGVEFFVCNKPARYKLKKLVFFI